MAESMESMFRRGMISKKQMGRMAKPAILKKTRAQKTKMAGFDSKKGVRDQGGVKDRGEVPVNEINHPTNQRAGRPALAGGLPSKGAQTRGNKAGPGPNSIDQSTGKKWPGAGSSVKKSARRVGVKGGVVPSAPSQYGGPSNRKYG